jgi:hypothetical protein
MPVVSINLSREAYELYMMMEDGTKSRKVSYLIERNWSTNAERTTWNHCPRCRGNVSPPVEIGDRRISGFGDLLVWSVDGWQMVGEEE